MERRPFQLSDDELDAALAEAAAEVLRSEGALDALVSAADTLDAGSIARTELRGRIRQAQREDLPEYQLAWEVLQAEKDRRTPATPGTPLSLSSSLLSKPRGDFAFDPENVDPGRHLNRGGINVTLGMDDAVIVGDSRITVALIDPEGVDVTLYVQAPFETPVKRDIRWQRRTDPAAE